MKYDKIEKGRFISRPNRFIAEIEINSNIEKCHVKNTGRCKELLVPGCTVYVQKMDNTNRKTAYDLISVYKGERLINMDSQAPNKVVYEWLLKENMFKNIKLIKPEFTYGSSRLDFYVETEKEKHLIEVKGVTLEEDGIAMFPDAPTERGIKHLLELKGSGTKGYKPYACFIIQMEGVKYFTPNYKTHKAFGECLKIVSQSGVGVIAFDCKVSKDSMTIKDRVDIQY